MNIFTPATADLSRDDEIDEYQSEHEEAAVLIVRHPWLSMEEREQAQLRLAEIGASVLVAVGSAAAEGAIRSGTSKVKELVQRIFERDPEKMKRKARRFQRKGKTEKAEALLAEAAVLEARRGNGA